jgi:peptide deformylase
MPLREIVTLPQPVLRRKAHKVTDISPEIQTIIDDMIETMRDAPGVGLAAPQVNLPLRLIVVEYGDDADEDEAAPKKLYVVLNPEITRFSSELEIGNEACLSIPGLVGEVERSVSVIVRGLNRQGKPTKIKASGWLARIFQHEIDHLDGVLFVDRAAKVWRAEDRPEQVVPAD